MKNIKYITKEQYYSLMGLRAAADIQWKILNSLENSAVEITKEKHDYGGHTSDFIHGSRNLDEMLKLLNIEVKNEKH